MAKVKPTRDRKHMPPPSFASQEDKFYYSVFNAASRLPWLTPRVNLSLDRLALGKGVPLITVTGLLLREGLEGESDDRGLWEGVLETLFSI